MKIIIAIDFDGVIVKHKGIERVDDFNKLGPIEDAREAVHWLIKQGFEPYVLTNRPKEEQKEIGEWLAKHDFPPMEVGNIKKYGTVLYIDDRAIRFTNWQDICKLLG